MLSKGEGAQYWGAGGCKREGNFTRTKCFLWASQEVRVPPFTFKLVVTVYDISTDSVHANGLSYRRASQDSLSSAASLELVRPRIFWTEKMIKNVLSNRRVPE